MLARRVGPALGLLGLQDQLEAIGGTLLIVSTPGGGTELSAAVPREA
jgi:signal transduction histidine kinase